MGRIFESSKTNRRVIEMEKYIVVDSFMALGFDSLSAFWLSSGGYVSGEYWSKGYVA